MPSMSKLDLKENFSGRFLVLGEHPHAVAQSELPPCCFLTPNCARLLKSGCSPQPVPVPWVPAHSFRERGWKALLGLGLRQPHQVPKPFVNAPGCAE